MFSHLLRFTIVFRSNLLPTNYKDKDLVALHQGSNFHLSSAICLQNLAINLSKSMVNFIKFYLILLYHRIGLLPLCGS